MHHFSDSNPSVWIGILNNKKGKQIWLRCKMSERVVLNEMGDKILHENEKLLDLSVGLVKGCSDIERIMHSHSNLEISVVISGRGRYRIDDKIYPFIEGDVFVLNNIERHGIVLDEDQQVENLVVHFAPKFIWQNNNHFDYHYLKMFYQREKNFSHKLNHSMKETCMIRELLLSMKNEFIEKDSGYRLMTKVKLMNILVLMLRYYGYNDSEIKHSEDLEVISKITEYIDGHLEEKITLDDLANLVHLNASYLSSFFKKYNGLSPVEYIIKKRISKACELLISSNKKIIEIAYLSGFSNLTNFNKMFKRTTGLTPSKYKMKKRR